MVMNSSGPIDLHAGTAGRSIATELGVSGAISLEGAAARGLAGKASGAITMPDDFYGKSTFTPFLGVYVTVGTTNSTIPAGCTQIEYIVVGGGGAGGGIDTGSGANPGYHMGGGGGGGGVVSGTLAVTAGVPITFVVGGGGTRGANPNLWTHGADSFLSYNTAAFVATGGGGLRGYFAVKAGTVGTGGANGAPNANAGGNGQSNRGSGGGGGAGGAGGNATGASFVEGTGGAGGAATTVSITGYTFTGAGGGGGGGTVFGGAPGAGGGEGTSQSATGYGGGGGGYGPGETPASYGGTGVGGDGYQGGIVIWYK